MFIGPVGPVEVFFYWPEAVFGNFYWPGAIGLPLASSPVATSKNGNRFSRFMDYKLVAKFTYISKMVDFYPQGTP